jgi:hypothetical protein
VDVAKVDRDAANVVMTIHICCKRLFQMFQLFQTNVARVLSGYYVCFTLMLQVFYVDVANVLFRCCICFAMATHEFSLCYRHMLQVFQLFWTFVAHVSSRCCKNRSGVVYFAIDLICSSSLLQLLGASVKHKKYVGVDRDRAGVRHGTVQDTERIRDT